MKKTLITEVSGVLAASVEQVWPVLRGERPLHEQTAEHTVAYQGGWWYRGEFSLAPDPEGTRVVHRVYNVATWMRWGVPLANRFFIGFDAQVRTSFADVLARMGGRLGCAARLS
ncbi:hypothetical protein [Nonomuraea insulae]|uniref:Polyketide cyclase/dehydrase/lipid transport protein n=1 Tax=Nonomuraea insulae TaxID=1616787 RepID=A0ABW1CCA6_9ACTN